MKCRANSMLTSLKPFSHRKKGSTLERHVRQKVPLHLGKGLRVCTERSEAVMVFASRTLRLSFLAAMLTLQSFAQPDSPLEVVKRVADKIIRETSFTVEKGADSVLRGVIRKEASFRDHTYFEWHYANGQMALAMSQLADATNEKRYRDFIERYCSTTLDTYGASKRQYETSNQKGLNYRLFKKGMLDNTSAAALPFVESLLRGESKASRFLVDEMANYVQHEQVRLSDSTLCRPDPKERTIWADDLFMSVPFLLRYGTLTENAVYYDDAAHQVIKFHEYLFDKKRGLAFHCWFDAEKKNGVAHWGRANGWMVWAMSEALLRLPGSHPKYKTVLSIFQEHMKGLVRYQNERGLWHQVLDHPESYEETSCTAMFVLALARGIRNGWIDENYRDNVTRGWDSIARRITDDGTVGGICQGTGIEDNLEFYFKRKTPLHDPRGLGAVLTAGVEVEHLLRSEF